MPEYRKDLPPPTGRIAKLAIDERGYPVPFFVAYVDGKPDHRVMDGAKLVRAVRDKLCWICGEKLGRFVTFTIGPMCAVNRNSAEPPSHLDCAQYSVRACPFLSHPRAHRRDKGLPEGLGVAGIGLSRNPGVTMLWTTSADEVTVRRIHADPERGVGEGLLFHIGSPQNVECYCEGREASPAEIQDAITTGLPALRDAMVREAVADGVARGFRIIAESTARVYRILGLSDADAKKAIDDLANPDAEPPRIVIPKSGPIMPAHQPGTCPVRG